MAQGLTPSGFSRTHYFGDTVITVYEQSTFHGYLGSDMGNIFFTDFAISITYTHASGEVRNYDVITDHPIDVSRVGKTETQVNKIQFEIAENALVKKPNASDLISVKGTVFQIEKIDSEGDGTLVFYLRRQGSRR